MKVQTFYTFMAQIFALNKRDTVRVRVREFEFDFEIERYQNEKLIFNSIQF